MKTTFVLITILSIMDLAKTTGKMVIYKAHSDPCYESIIDEKVVREDSNGRKCWGTIPIRTCEGRCPSFSYAYWIFPHKKSSHTVCIHTERVESTVNLTCDYGVADEIRSYKYIEANGCSCSKCYSADTTCEGTRKRGNTSPPVIVQEKNHVLDFLLTLVKMDRNESPQLVPPQVLQPPVYP